MTVKITLTPAQQLLAKLRERENAKILALAGSKRKLKSADACVSEFVAELERLKSRHSTKQPSEKYKMQWVFRRPTNFGRKTDVLMYCRMHLIVALDQLKGLVNEMREGKSKVSAKAMRKYEPYLSDYIFDLRLIAQTLERHKDRNDSYLFFRGSKGYVAEAWQTFQASKQLYWMSAVPTIRMDHRQAHITAIFALRQALEAKFQRIVAVYAYNKNGETPKLKHGFYYLFIKDNLTMFQFPQVDFLLIEKIYDWCNVIVHNSVQPFPWQVSYALETCRGLFAGGPIPGGGNSIYGGVIINDKELMQRAFAQHFCTEYQHGVWSIEFEKPEAV